PRLAPPRPRGRRVPAEALRFGREPRFSRDGVRTLLARGFLGELRLLRLDVAPHQAREGQAEDVLAVAPGDLRKTESVSQVVRNLQLHECTQVGCGAPGESRIG